VVTGLKHQQEKRSMDYFAGLDVSVKDTSVCVVDDTAKIMREVRVASEPDALLAVLRDPTYRFKRIGLEAGPLSQSYRALLLARALMAKNSPSSIAPVGSSPGIHVVRKAWLTALARVIVPITHAPSS
jgi:hypothetical protein